MDSMWIFTTLTYLIPPFAVVLALTLWYTSTRRKTSLLDAWWGWLGPGSRWQGNGRAFTGTVDGRAVKVTWFDNTTTITVAGHPGVRAGFGRRARPTSVVDEAEVGGRRVNVDGEHVGFGDTRGDVTALVSQPQVRPALDVLLAEDEGSIRSVDVEPATGVVWFARNVHLHDMTPDRTRRWVEAAVTLARAAEGPLHAT
jgi:hypothetical protein